MARYRADLIDTAWDVETTYGTLPTTLTQGWGIVTAGITLPDPRYEFTPFYGVGVDDRNLLTYIQGREVFEGAIGTVMLCHDASRLIMGDSLGQIFNVFPKHSHTTATATATTISAVGLTNASVAVSAGASPTHIAVISQASGTAVQPFTDTFAYIGAQSSSDTLTVHHTMDTNTNTDLGWQGKLPATGSGNCRVSVHSIARTPIAQGSTFINSNTTTGNTINIGVKAAADTITSSIGIRETLQQNSFTLGSKIAADSGAALTSNFTGCKVGSVSIAMSEGAPVTFSIDFTGQDMVHNMPGATDNLTVNKWDSGVKAPAMVKVTEQPYFFSKANLKFGTETFAKFRNLTISVANALDPRYYITQSNTTDNRQILTEILEGRRAISISGSLDMDDTASGATAGMGSNAPDIKFLQYLLNQGAITADVRDQQAVVGVSLEVELRRYADASESAKDFDTFTFKLPADSANVPSSTNPGLILSAARFPIPAPPQVHQNIDITGIAQSMRVEIKDSFGG